MNWLERMRLHRALSKQYDAARAELYAVGDAWQIAWKDFCEKNDEESFIRYRAVCDRENAAFESMMIALRALRMTL